MKVSLYAPQSTNKGYDDDELAVPQRTETHKTVHVGTFNNCDQLHLKAKESV